ncbi:hypothetical protein TVAG_122820 [Trichomonas vaginalis G3]|uniref:HEAT repeat family protein n=1 Tax=Trichomonas vaginalis (strain ATCC PRA-98 / G3) TaxID=412133 RepID=A2DN39_TRIV3|nr:meiotic spindle elongation [Trichomonas vaginalis G3]EAY18216.1 hypothetical protein TVAG_122820 [Trichomonas vaginalis G3]KAI5491521.1 meiotic spindle elongation [Trichomonas vaginalis G3]|eukprot:XP_001579202.1 hypothetical protein [Trichomonas vaginalis G3]
MSSKYNSLLESLRSQNPLERNRTSSMLADLLKDLQPNEVRDVLIQIKSIERQSLEMQAQICRALGNLVPLVGGRDYISKVLDTIEFYLETDDDNIREKCIASIDQLVKSSNTEEIEKIFIPFFIKLSKDAFYGKRSASALIICLASKYLTEQESNSLFPILETLVSDQSIEVRRDLAKAMYDAFNSHKFIVEKLILILSKLINDQTVIVQKNIAPALTCLTHEKYNDFVDDAINIIVANKKFENVISILSNIENLYITKETQQYLYSFIFTDEHPLVRAESAKHLKFIAKSNVLSKEKLDESIKLLAKDSDPQVLFELAKSIPNLIENHKEACEFALSILTESTDTRISNQAYEAIAETGVGIEIAINRISQIGNSHWRTMISMCCVIGLMSKTLDVDSFNEKLLQYLYILFESKVWGVRSQAVDTVKDIMQVYGTDWFFTKIYDYVIEKFSKGNYLDRQLSVLVACSSPDYSKVSGFLKQITSDPTSNVRLMLAKECPKQFTEILDILSHDSDQDVSYYANQRKN